MKTRRLKNRIIAKLITRFPSLSGIFTDLYVPWESGDIPWTSIKKVMNKSRIAIVTTAGIHHKDQKPFNMLDPEGDPTFREIDIRRPLSEIMITHDYYDHTDADKDVNIVFPIERLREFQAEGLIGGLADIHYGFMGHIDGRHIHTLVTTSAPEVAAKLKSAHVDIVLLTPA